MYASLGDSGLVDSPGQSHKDAYLASQNIDPDKYYRIEEIKKGLHERQNKENDKIVDKQFSYPSSSQNEEDEFHSLPNTNRSAIHIYSEIARTNQSPLKYNYTKDSQSDNKSILKPPPINSYFADQ